MRLVADPRLPLLLCWIRGDYHMHLDMKKRKTVNPMLEPGGRHNGLLSTFGWGIVAGIALAAFITFAVVTWSFP